MFILAVIELPGVLSDILKKLGANVKNIKNAINYARNNRLMQI